MFSKQQKHQISFVVEKLLLSLHHPEMPTEKPDFTLHVKGKEGWSWADIEPNWKFGEANPPGVNPFNELMGQHPAVALLQEVDLGLHQADERGPCLCSQCDWRKRVKAYLFPENIPGYQSEGCGNS